MFLRLASFTVKIISLLLIIGLFGLTYLIYNFSKDLPDYSQLKNYYPSSVTRIYSADGKLMEEYAKEYRIFVPIKAIPQFVKEAFIATEDKNFYQHQGIDVTGVARAMLKNLVNLLQGRSMEGGSTITQQVVKNFLLSSERSIKRKIREALLSYRISQFLTKDEILELYLNQIYLGKGAYGVAAASLSYFNKSIEELTLSEAAILASLPKAPSRFNPQKNLKRAVIRKNYVLGRMQAENYITESQAKEAKQEGINLRTSDQVQTLQADYYAEKVRSEVINMFGEEYFYNAGLTIISCVDSALQKAAQGALRFGIKEYDQKRGYRGVIDHISLVNWPEELTNLSKNFVLYDYHLAVVTKVEKERAAIGLTTKLAKEENIQQVGHIFLKDSKWAATNLRSMTRLLQVGDVILVEARDNKYYLQQTPEVNGGIIVMENETGRVLAAEGGYDYRLSKFDRTIKASRQPGSLIKPFIYLAALEKGAKLNDIFEDAPISIEQGPGLPLWEPKNYENNFLGPMTMRKGLEKSRNTVTVRVGQFATLPKVTEIIKRFGINEEPPKLHSIVLGAIETSLMKMTMAYSIIANGGKKLEPQYIELIKDRKGNVIYKRDYTECEHCRIGVDDLAEEIIIPKIPEIDAPRIIDEAYSYQLTSLLMGSVERGTSRRAKIVKQIIAGKTGTTNNAKDAWFMGFTPKIVVGTYIGYDNPRSMGANVSGASIALPVFVNFMQNGYKNMPSLDFLVPDSIDIALVDYETGQLATSSKGAIIEAFRKYQPQKEGQITPLIGDIDVTPRRFEEKPQLADESEEKKDDDDLFYNRANDPFSKVEAEE